MTLWRDPFDELIADLERTLPSTPKRANYSDELVGCQIWVGATLYGAPEDVERVSQDPRVTAWWASMERLAAARLEE